MMRSRSNTAPSAIFCPATWAVPAAAAVASDTFACTTGAASFTNSCASETTLCTRGSSHACAAFALISSYL